MENEQKKERKPYRKNRASQELRNQISAEIEFWKEKRRMTNTSIASALGTDRRTFQTMLTGKDVLLGNLEATAKVLGCELEIKFVKKGE